MCNPEDEVLLTTVERRPVEVSRSRDSLCRVSRRQALSMLAGTSLVPGLFRSALNADSRSTELADRCWFADGRILIGPAYVGEHVGNRHECWLDGAESAIYIVSGAGTYHKIDIKPRPSATGIVALQGWTNLGLPEITGQAHGWHAIESPRSVEELGGYYGYTWYRASFSSDRPRNSALLFTGAADRLHVFLNSKKQGIWGRGHGAVRGPLPVHLGAGHNDFVFLCDNMGRAAEGDAHDRKGIWDAAYLDSVERPLTVVDWSELPRPPRAETWKFKTYRARDANPRSSIFQLRATAPFTKGEGGLLSFRWVSQYAWIYVNGHFVGEHTGNESLTDGSGFSNFRLDPALLTQKTEILIAFFGDPTRDVAGHIRLFAYPESNSVRDWCFKAFEKPTEPHSAHSVGPQWWRCCFPKPRLPGPLFLVTTGLSKGQVFLNNKALGRYWTVGPQKTLFLPGPWLTEQNSLELLDEEGATPHGVYIVRDVRCPTNKILA